jgi:hypothetical protein
MFSGPDFTTNMLQEGFKTGNIMQRDKFFSVSLELY